MGNDAAADIVHDVFASVIRHVWYHGCCNCLEHLRTIFQQIVLETGNLACMHHVCQACAWRRREWQIHKCTICCTCCRRCSGTRFMKDVQNVSSHPRTLVDSTVGR